MDYYNMLLDINFFLQEGKQIEIEIKQYYKQGMRINEIVKKNLFNIHDIEKYYIMINIIRNLLNENYDYNKYIIDIVKNLSTGDIENMIQKYNIQYKHYKTNFEICNTYDTSVIEQALSYETINHKAFQTIKDKILYTVNINQIVLN